MMRATSPLFVLCVLCTMTSARPSWAAPDALTHKAAVLYDEGFAAYKQSKWADARASFLAAWGIKMHWQIAASLGDCEVQLGLYRDAAEHLAYALRKAPAERQSAELKQLYATARAKIGTLTIVVDVPGADVAVDSKVVGKAPLEDPVFVDPGPHTVEARFQTHVTTVRLDAREGTPRIVELSVKEPPPVVEKRPLWPAIVVGGVAVVGVGVGAGLTAAASAKRADAVALGTLGAAPACAGTPSASTAMKCQALANDSKAHDTLNKAALGTFVAGGAFAVAAAGLGAWAAMGPKDATNKNKTSVRVAPMLGREAAGVVMVGAW